MNEVVQRGVFQEKVLKSVICCCVNCGGSLRAPRALCKPGLYSRRVCRPVGGERRRENHGNAFKGSNGTAFQLHAFSYTRSLYLFSAFILGFTNVAFLMMRANVECALLVLTYCETVCSGGHSALSLNRSMNKK